MSDDSGRPEPRELNMHPSQHPDAGQFKWTPGPRQIVRSAAVRALNPWIRSIDLGELDSIDFGAVDIVSLDVFDTCVGRLVGDPTDVFRLVGRRAPEIVVTAIPDWGGEEWFAQARIAAERRRRPVDGEVTFDEIWDEMASSIADPSAREFLRADELLVESIVSIGRRAVCQFAERAARSTQLVYLSDMYLDAATIQGLLDAAGFPSAPVIVSSETGVTKRTGDAYRLVCERFKVAPDRILHVGDNYMADGWAAARARVRPVIVPSWKSRAVTEAPLPTPVSLDDGVALALAAHTADNDLPPAEVERQAATAVASPASTALAQRCGHAALGPLQIGFVSWLHHSLPEGVPLLFAARDMRDTRDLFRRTSSTGVFAGPDRTPHRTWYLHGSRRAFALAAMANGITSEDRDVFTAGRGLISERDLWLRMGFDDDDAPVRSAATTPRPFRDREAVWQSVLQHSDLVVERAQAELVEVGRYWAAEDLPLTGRAAYVDLGWRGTVQRLLERCVEALGGDLILDGYYLALIEEPSSRLRAQARGWIVDRGSPTSTRIGIETGIPIWELAFQAPEGSTRSYRDGRPVLGPAPASRPIQDALQLGGREFTTAWIDLATELDVAFSLGAEVAQPMLRLINTPTPLEASTLGQMEHTDQPGDVGIRSVVATATATRSVDPRRFSRTLRASEWRPGLLASMGLRRLGLRLASSGLSGLKLAGLMRRQRHDQSQKKPAGHAYTVRPMSTGGERAYRDRQ